MKFVHTVEPIWAPAPVFFLSSVFFIISILFYFTYIYTVFENENDNTVSTG